MSKNNFKIDIGLSEESRGEIAAGLSGLLADSYTLYLMTHNFHWNVKGPMFNSQRWSTFIATGRRVMGRAENPARVFASWALLWWWG